MPDSSSAFELWLIHGNLQTPDVWAPLIPGFEAAGLSVHTVDLYATLARSMEDWAMAFNASVRAGTLRRFLLGYSLGGRLALQALLADSALWDGAILVGADTGLADEDARVRRRETDAAWGQRFLKEPLENVLADWNAQPVFRGRPAPMNAGALFRYQSLLSRLFTAYSKGVQPDLLPYLPSLALKPMLWLTGYDDEAFTRVARRAVSVLPGSRQVIVHGAAHRVPWEAPNAFMQATLAFIAASVPISDPRK